MAVEETSYDEWFRAKVQAVPAIIDAKREGQSRSCDGSCANLVSRLFGHSARK